MIDRFEEQTISNALGKLSASYSVGCGDEISCAIRLDADPSVKFHNVRTVINDDMILITLTTKQNEKGEF